MTLGETQTQASRRTVRPASLLLVALMVGAMLLHALRGPGMLRGVSAIWTMSFYASGVAAAVLLLACARRMATTSARRQLPDAR